MRESTGSMRMTSGRNVTMIAPAKGPKIVRGPPSITISAKYRLVAPP